MRARGDACGDGLHRLPPGGAEAVCVEIEEATMVVLPAFDLDILSNDLPAISPQETFHCVSLGFYPQS
jgi:hypothetical protein